MISIRTIETKDGHKTIVKEKRGGTEWYTSITHEGPTPPKEAIEQAKRSIAQKFALLG